MNGWHEKTEIQFVHFKICPYISFLICSFCQLRVFLWTISSISNNKIVYRFIAERAFAIFKRQTWKKHFIKVIQLKMQWAQENNMHMLEQQTQQEVALFKWAAKWGDIFIGAIAINIENVSTFIATAPVSS